MSVTFLTPVDVTPGTASAWTDVDVSAHVSASATGVLLSISNANSTNRAVGTRKNGSTDTATSSIRAGSTFRSIGVDGSGIFEVYIDSTTLQVVMLLGYFEDEATFFTNGVHKDFSKDSWTDYDISGDTGGDTATAAILFLKQTAFVRENGSTDARTLGNSTAHSTAFIGLDGSEIFEGRRDTNSADAWLVGYMTDGHTSVGLNATDVTPASDDTWTDLSALGSSNAVGGIYEGYGNAVVGVAKKGVTPTLQDKALPYSHNWLYSECDGAQIVQGFAATLGELYLHGYFDVVSGGSAPVMASFLRGA